MATPSSPAPQPANAGKRTKRSRASTQSLPSVLFTKNICSGYTTFEWEPTSLTHLPRGWSRISRAIAAFLVSIGLGILVATYEGAFKKDFTEPKKVAIGRSRTTSIFKSLVHVIPIGFALYEIINNLRGCYVGQPFTRQSYYQGVAKAHEILIDASLASIVLSYIRYQVTYSDGLPFGTFLGGLQFLSISYLWSRELWSSAFSATYSFRKRILSLLLFVLCGVIAATAGPSSATLLIPRELLWSRPSTYTAINATFEETWPNQLDPQHVSPECFLQSESTTETLCPATSWQGIRAQLEYEVSVVGNDFNDPDSSGTAFWYSILTSPGQAFSGAYHQCPFDGHTGQGTQICGSAQPVGLTNAAFSDDYLSTQTQSTFIDIYHTVDNSAYAAFTAIQCLFDTINGTEDDSLVRFPQLSRTQEEYAKPPQEMTLEQPRKAEIYSRARSNLSEFDLAWVDLPISRFGEGVSGAMVLYPRDSDLNAQQEIAACTMIAG